MLSDMMQSHDPGTKRPPAPVRALFCGATRTGKTSISLSWPNPLIISPAHEGGLRIVDAVPFHVTSIVCNGFLPTGTAPALEVVAQQLEAAAANGRLLRADGSPVGTVILDSVSHFQAMLVRDLVGDGSMDQQSWGRFLNAWQRVRQSLWRLPCHVVVTALDDIRTDQKQRVLSHGIKLSGQIATLLPAECDIIAYTEQEQGNRFLAHVCRYGAFYGGTRLPGMSQQTYQNFNYPEHVAPYYQG